MRQILMATVLGLVFSGTAYSTTYDLADFVDANTGAKIKAVSIYGADAKSLFDFIKAQSPSTYSISRSTYFIYEHIRGKELFCAKDTQKSSTGAIVKVTYRCDLTVSGQGDLAPQMIYIGPDYGGGDGGSGGGSDGP